MQTGICNLGWNKQAQYTATSVRRECLSMCLTGKATFPRLERFPWRGQWQHSSGPGYWCAPYWKILASTCQLFLRHTIISTPGVCPAVIFSPVVFVLVELWPQFPGHKYTLHFHQPCQLGLLNLVHSPITSYCFWLAGPSLRYLATEWLGKREWPAYFFALCQITMLKIVIRQWTSSRVPRHLARGQSSNIAHQK